MFLSFPDPDSYIKGDDLDPAPYSLKCLNPDPIRNRYKRFGSGFKSGFESGSETGSETFVSDPQISNFFSLYNGMFRTPKKKTKPTDPAPQHCNILYRYVGQRKQKKTKASLHLLNQPALGMVGTYKVRQPNTHLLLIGEEGC